MKDDRADLRAENAAGGQVVVVNQSPLLLMLLVVVLIGIGAAVGLRIADQNALRATQAELREVKRELRLLQAYLQEVNASLLRADLIEPGSAALLAAPREDQED